MTDENLTRQQVIKLFETTFERTYFLRMAILGKPWKYEIEGQNDGTADVKVDNMVEDQGPDVATNGN